MNGDETLMAVGGRLREVLRPHDTVARLGGDEFVVLCEDLEDDRAAVRVAERVLAALDRPVLCGDHDGDFMFRHGEKSCQVSVETDDGHTITWRRIKGKVSYVLDAVEVHRAEVEQQRWRIEAREQGRPSHEGPPGER